MTAPTERYAHLAASPDPEGRRVAAVQLARLQRRHGSIAVGGDVAPSPWQHVPIADLLTEAGNVTVERANGTIVCGHEPIHGSRSGTCLVAWPAEGRWWCSSCRQGGDAVALVMSLHGRGFHRARVYLGERFGFPKQKGARHG